MSQNNIPITSSQVFTFEFSALAASEGAESASSGASYTFLITIGTSLGIGLLTGGSMESMWSLANTLQLIFYFSLLDLYYSSDLKMTFEFMSYSNFDNPVTSYASKLVQGLVGFVNSPVNTRFSDVGFASTDIITNSFDKLLMVALFILFACALALIVKLIK